MAGNLVVFGVFHVSSQTCPSLCLRDRGYSVCRGDCGGARPGGDGEAASSHVRRGSQKPPRDRSQEDAHDWGQARHELTLPFHNHNCIHHNLISGQTRTYCWERIVASRPSWSARASTPLTTLGNGRSPRKLRRGGWPLTFTWIGLGICSR